MVSSNEMNVGSENEPQKSPTLLRVLGPRIAIAVVVGNVIGSGIFLKPGNIARECGDFGIIIAVWVAGGLLCILGALCFAELAGMYPQAGGLYVYLREAYGRIVAFLYGWNEVLFGKPAATAAVAVAFVGSLHVALGWEATLFTEVTFTIGLISVIAWLNIMGVVWGGRLQLVITIIKVGFLALVALAPFAMLPFVETVDFANYSTTIQPEQASTIAQIGVVLLAVMWAYNGWHGVTPLSEEIRHPQRNIPFALFAGIGILIVLYVGANFAYHSVLSMEEMAAAGDHAAERMLEKLWGRIGKSAMSAVIMCSTFGAINTMLLQTPRISFAMGRDRVFFQSLGQVHVKHRTPAIAIFVLALMAILFVTTVAVAKYALIQSEPAIEQPTEPATTSSESGSNTESPYVEPTSDDLLSVIVRSLRNDSIFQILTNFVIFTASIFYMLVVFAVFVIRFREPDRHRPYKTWGYPVVPVLFLLVYVWFVSQIYLTNPLEALTGLAIIALGLPVYLGFRRLAS